jgi:hypothetical protein
MSVHLRGSYMVSRPYSFIVPDSEIPNLKLLVSATADQLRNLENGLQGERFTVGQDRLAQAIEKKTGLPAELSRPFLGALLRLTTVRRATDATAEELVEQVESQLREKDESVWSSKDAQNWDERRDQIARLLVCDGPLELSAKTAELGWEHQCLIVEFRVITDARPVFDDRAGSLLAYLASQQLAIVYQEAGRMQEIHIAVSSRDLKAMVAQMNRALEKQALLAKSLYKTGVPVVDTGDDTND